MILIIIVIVITMMEYKYEVLEEIMTSHDLDDKYENAYILACDLGELEIMKIISKKYRCTDGSVLLYVLSSASMNGYLNIIQWIYSNYSISDEISADVYDIACEFCNMDIVQWFITSKLV